MSQYRGYFAPGGVDPWGLDWKILRNGGEYAQAVRTDGDETFEELANLIGLDISQLDSWLITTDRGSFFVPNTILSVWAGDGTPGIKLGGKRRSFDVGKAAVSWGADLKYLKKLGFKVIEVDVRDQGWVNSPTEIQENYHKESTKLASLCTSYTDKKQGLPKLHGLYFWGHGSPDFLGKKDAYTKEGWRENYESLSKALQYKLGFCMLNACFSDYSAGNKIEKYWYPNKPFKMQDFTEVYPNGITPGGGRDLHSGTAGSIFRGSKNVLSPFNRIPGLKKKLPELPFTAHHHPSDALLPGNQGTAGAQK